MTQPTAQIRHVVSRTGFSNPLTLGVLVEDVDYLKVYADVDLLQLGVDYTVLGVGDPGGVSITIIGAEDPNEYVGVETFTALYDPVLQQGADLALGGAFGRAFESALDAQNRQLQAVAERAYKVDASAIQAEQAAADAEAYAALAEEYAALAAAGAGAPIFETKALAEAYRPAIAPAFIELAFLDSDKVPASGGLYRSVGSEPIHEAKLQTADGTWYELAAPEVWVEQLGAKPDDTNFDCAPAFERAYATGRPIRVGPGRFNCGRAISFNGAWPVIMRGAGSDGTYGGQQDHPNTTTLIGNHENDCVIEIATATAAAGESMRLEGFEVSGKPSDPPGDQHGILVRSRTQWSTYDDLVFSDITGCAIAFDPAASTYSQNVAIRDTSFLRTGGDLGLTQEPANSAGYLACTLLVLNNVNHDHSINPVSPRSRLWDFRAFRGISADNFLLEGDGDATTTILMDFASGGFYEFRGLHHEFPANAPTYSFHFDADTNGRFYSTSELTVRVTSMNSAQKFGFDAGVEVHAYVADWTYYNAASPSDLVSFADNTGGHLVVERLHVKAPFMVPMHQRGQLDIVSVRCMDQLAPMLEQGATKIASWRGANGSPTSFNTHVLAFTTANLASSAVEEDNNDNRLQVWRGTSNVGAAPTLRCQINVPFDWLEITLNYDSKTDAFTVGSVLTGGTSGARAKIVANTDNGTTGTLKLKMLTATDFSTGETITDAAGGSATVNGAVTKQGPWMTLAVRWKMTIDAADIASGISGSITSPATAVWSMDRTQSGYNDEWRTAVMLFRPNSAQVNSSFALAGGTPANAVVIRVAAVDLYLGRRWSEPLDLSYT